MFIKKNYFIFFGYERNFFILRDRMAIVEALKSIISHLKDIKINHLGKKKPKEPDREYAD